MVPRAALLINLKAAIDDDGKLARSRLASRWFRSVVFPLPKNSASTVTDVAIP